MSELSGQDSGTNETFADIFAAIPVDELDTAEVEGGLTWRQTAVLAFTASYLRIPGDEAAQPPFDERLTVRQAVDKAFRANVAEKGRPVSAKEAVISCLEVASNEYAKLCEVKPEWSTDKNIVEELLASWRDESQPHMTELLASNVLWRMFNRTSTN